MRITVGEDKFYLQFAHFPPPKDGEETLMNDFGTDCEILKLRDDNDKEGELVAKGASYLSPVDQYEKWVGRKVALTRALNAAGFDREIRRTIWQEYFKRVKK